MKRIGLAILILFIVVGRVKAQGQIIFQMADPAQDDRGAGGLLYPSHQVFVPGLFDLRKFTVLRDDEYFYFDFQFTNITNPFGAPEGYFHQRLEVYFDTNYPGGNEKITFAQYELETSPNYGWEACLSVAPFGEGYLEITTPTGTKRISTGVSSYVQPDEKTIRVQVEQALLPEPDRSWRYYVLVGSFDGLAPEFWRDLGINPWDVGGEGPPIFDLLAPRWGLRSQKRQLGKGVLHPMGPGWFGNLPWLLIVLVLALAVGIVFWGIYYWRWLHARN